MEASYHTMTSRKTEPSLGGKRAPRPKSELASYGAALDIRLPGDGGELREARANALAAGTPRDSAAPSLKNGVNVILQTLKNLPDAPGCYRMLDAGENAIYIGMAKNLRKRVAAYARPDKQTNRIARMISLVRYVEIIETETEIHALLLETNLIKRLEPKFNVLLRDDKSYPYILIATGHDFPRLMRHRGAHTAPGHYFGPFAGVGAVRNSLAALERAFLLRSCSDSVFSARSRPCLLYDLKRCSAPCVGKITREDYDGLVRQTRQTLAGSDALIRERLTRDMRRASDAQDFETAARLRDRLRALAAITADQAVNLSQGDDADLFACAQNGTRTCIQVFFFRGGRNYGNRAFFPSGCDELSEGRILADFVALFYAKAPPPPLVLTNAEPDDAALLAEALSQRAGHAVRVRVPERGAKRRAMEHAVHNAAAALTRRLAGENSEEFLRALADILGLDGAIERVEVFDNSHLRGSFPYGAMVVATADGFRRRDYRKFRIQSAASSEDDLAMMREVLTRRLAHIRDGDSDRPDLWVIDGGRNQLAVAREVLGGGDGDSDGDGGGDIEGPALLAIAKGPGRDPKFDRVFVVGRDAPLDLSENVPVLHYIQRLRDEAHRFAVSSHRRGRAKAQLRSRLDDIPGVGVKRRHALLHHFGDVRAISRASVKDLTRVGGISAGLARQIHDSLRD